MIKSGISQIGGKFRLYKELLKRTPYHEFFLSPFCGACWYELNKPRCRYECFNDLNSELINYFIQIRKHPKEFDEMKQGIFGLVSQEICNRIVRGDITPKDDLERAYFYYYLNKLTFGGGIWMVRKNPPFKGIDPSDQAGKFDKESVNYSLINTQAMSQSGKGRVDTKEVEKAKQQYAYKTSGGKHGIISRTGGFMNRDTDIEKAKEQYEYKTKGYIGLIDQQTMPGRIDKPGIKEAKEEYEWKTKGWMGLINPRVMKATKNKKIEEIKANYRGLVGMGVVTEINRDLKKKEKLLRNSNIKDNITQINLHEKLLRKKSSFKGINPKTTRPFTNNDLGLLSPLDPECIKRLRYVNLTSYDFRKVYKLFYKAFYERKGLAHECFLYMDRPYPGTEKYYRTGFSKKEHNILNNIVLESPFHILESLGGECEWIIDIYKEAGFIIDEVYTRYSTDANTQKKSKEFLIMNYDINELPLMTQSIDQKTMEKYL